MIISPRNMPQKCKFRGLILQRMNYEQNVNRKREINK